MYRGIEVNTAKNIDIVKAGSAALTRGAPVVKDYTDDTLDAATTTGLVFLVDVSKNYDGMNAIVSPQDKDFETIAAGATCLAVPTYVGEKFATTELTIGSLTKGDYLKASSGKFVAAATNDVCNYVYGGTYSDPTGLTMYVVECVPAHTVTA